MADNAPPEEQNTDTAEAVEIPAKLRVHALAKLLGVTSKEVLAKLTELGESVKTAHSSVTRDQGERVRDAFRPPSEATPQETPAPQDATAASQETTAAPEGSTSEAPAFVAPLFLPPDPSVRARSPRSEGTAERGGTAEAEDTGSRQKSDEQQSSEADESPGDSHGDSSEAGSDDGEGRSGRSSRRRRRGRRGRGRGRGEQNGDKQQDGQESGDDSGDPSASGGKDGSGQESSDAGRSGKPRRGDSGKDTGGSEDSRSAKDGSGKKGDSDKKDGSGKKDESGKNGPDEGDSGDGGDGNGGSRRRRRRRRRRNGDSDSSSSDDPPNTVVHEREPRSKRAGRDEVQGISGSTRLEAKRQRRRDGREAGRRRPPILSEAEFLARRESVDRVMVVREKPAADGRGPVTQVGVLEDKVLVEHFVTSSATPSMVGNVYLGRVQNVLPSMEAAFVDIGRGRNGVLYAGEVDWAAAGLGGSARKIEQALKPGDQVVVQVTKDPVGHKGARLTTQISMAGRFLVYVPGGTSTGISRKLPDTERKRLKSILRQIVPSDAGVIIRTASEGVSEDELRRDVDRLKALWEDIKKASEDAKAAKSGQPKALYEEPDLLIKVIRDLFNEDFGKLVIEGDDAWQTVASYIERVAPDLMERIERYERNGSSVDVFTAYRIDEQLAKALERKVWLPSGGTLVIDRTEAMTVIDVNTGKFTGSGGNLEETVTRNNLEAAEEVVRQMRLRDIGGMIVVDFIDMVLESNRDLVLRRLTEALGRDRTRHQVSEVTSLGLVQMTRKRLGTGLVEAFSTPCEHCHGRGLVLHDDPIVAEPDSGSGKNESRRGRRSKKSGGGGQSNAKEAQKQQAAHHHSEHPMFKAMAEADEKGTEAKGADTKGADAPASADTGADAKPAGGKRGSGKGRADADDRGDGSDGRSSSSEQAAAQTEPAAAGEDKSAAIAKIEAAVARSTGPKRRRARRPQSGGSGQEQPAAADAAAPAHSEPAGSAEGAGRQAQSAPEPPQREGAQAPATATGAPQQESAEPEASGSAAGPTGTPVQPATRRRSRRASRPASAPTHAEESQEPIRSEVFVPSAQPAQPSADTDGAGAVQTDTGADSPEPPARRPRRRAAVRRAGPPADEDR